MRAIFLAIPARARTLDTCVGARDVRRVALCRLSPPRPGFIFRREYKYPRSVNM